MRKLILGLLIPILFLTGCGGNAGKSETGASRGLGAKGICAFLVGEEYNEDLLLPYEDVGEGDWFFPYVKRLYARGKLLPSPKFQGDKPLTLEESVALIKRINPEYAKKIKLTHKNAQSPVSLTAWTRLLAEAGDTSLTEVEVFDFREGTLYTDKGAYSALGLDFMPFRDKRIGALIKDREVLGMGEVINDEACFKAAYIEPVKGGVMLNVGGARRRMDYEGSILSSVGEVTLKEGKIKEIDFLESIYEGRIRRISHEMEIDGRVFSLTDETVFYIWDNDGVRPGEKGEVLCGDRAEVFYEGDRARAVVISQRANPSLIRVVLKTSDYEDYYHDEIVIEGDALVYYGDKSTEISGATELSEFFDGVRRIFIKPKAGELCVSSVKRAGGAPCYKGVLEAEKTSEGYILINEVNMEDYIRGVVPGEISGDFTLAAAEAQALCARSFAFNRFYENKFAHLGGNLDDSTATQVYNNYPENEISAQAVINTEGKYIVSDNTVICANFFSTSCGVRANSAEVWLGGNTPEYLGYKKFYSGDYGELSNEAKARVFFQARDVVCPEGDCQWFRWETELPVEALMEKLPELAHELYNENPEYISGENGFDPGTPKSVYVTERGEGGNIISLCIEGSLCTVGINGQAAIRRVFAPCLNNGFVLLRDNHGNEYKNYPMLPSGFFVFDEVFDHENRLISLKLYGGGFGHGVGLSQRGADCLGKRGYSGEEIVRYYFPKTEVERIFG